VTFLITSGQFRASIIHTIRGAIYISSGETHLIVSGHKDTSLNNLRFI